MSLCVLATLEHAQGSDGIGHSLLLRLVLRRACVECLPRHLDQSSGHGGRCERTAPVGHILGNIHEGREAKRSQEGAQPAAFRGLIEEVGTGVHLSRVVRLCPGVDFGEAPVDEALGEGRAHAGFDPLARRFLSPDDHTRTLYRSPEVVVNVESRVDSLPTRKRHVVLGGVGVEVGIIPQSAGAETHVVEAHPTTPLEAELLDDVEGSDAAAHFNLFVASRVLVVSEP
mmetsp:Transcript_5879/g.13545  ORF Transcript_5879/g.13545 Transcript_5879/m.13545 type:complete len:228 (-) Transcript_5879:3056-3739(-)